MHQLLVYEQQKAPPLGHTAQLLSWSGADRAKPEMPEPGTSGRNVHVLFDVLSSTVCLFIAFATTDCYYHDFASHRAVDFYAAGVLPVAYDPTTARAYMLLGYEGFRSSWADFSGRREFDEIESTRTACRELIEETGGVIADMASEDACLRLLDETHVTTSTLYSERRKSTFVHYLAPVKFDASIPVRFASHRGEIAHSADRQFLEKTKMAWVDIDEFHTAVSSKCGKEKIFFQEHRMLHGPFARLLCQIEQGVGESLLARLKSPLLLPPIALLNTSSSVA